MADVDNIMKLVMKSAQKVAFDRPDLGLDPEMSLIRQQHPEWFDPSQKVQSATFAVRAHRVNFDPVHRRREQQETFGKCGGKCGEAPCIEWNLDNTRKKILSWKGTDQQANEFYALEAEYQDLEAQANELAMKRLQQGRGLPRNELTVGTRPGGFRVQ